MGESMESLFRRGGISKKVMARKAKPAILKKTRSGVPTKMASFDGKEGRRDQGGVRDRGMVGPGEINRPRRQTAGRPADAGGLPSKGAQARGNKAGPNVNAINENTGKKWPGAGSGMKASKRRVGVKGGVVPSAPSQYGGPNNRKYG
jgi:hypothetical protein